MKRVLDRLDEERRTIVECRVDPVEAGDSRDLAGDVDVGVPGDREQPDLVERRHDAGDDDDVAALSTDRRCTPVLCGGLAGVAGELARVEPTTRTLNGLPATRVARPGIVTFGISR